MVKTPFILIFLAKNVATSVFLSGEIEKIGGVSGFDNYFCLPEDQSKLENSMGTTSIHL